MAVSNSGFIDLTEICSDFIDDWVNIAVDAKDKVKAQGEGHEACARVRHPSKMKLSVQLYYSY